MLIRAWTAADQTSVSDLVRSVAADHDCAATHATIHGTYQNSLHPFHRTLMALDQYGLSGVGTLWENTLHPARWRVTLHGQQAFWTHGGAGTMLDHLRALRPDSRPLQAAASDHDDVSCGFWQRQGFSQLMRTRSGVLHPGIVPASVMADIDSATQRIIATGYRLVTLTDLGDEESDRRRWARLHAAIYEQSHQWNPVRALTDEEACDLFLDPDEVLPESMIMALQGEHLAAVSSLRRREGEAAVDLGWVGVLPRYAQQQDDLIYSLVGECLHDAASTNRPVMVEVDEANATLWELMQRLPLQLEPDWLTFIER